MPDTLDCAATITADACVIGEYFEGNLCKECGENCYACIAGECILCDEGYGPVAASTACAACSATVAGMYNCLADLASPYVCNMGYGLIGGACVECSVENCDICDTSADVCDSCADGFSDSLDGATCHECDEGCAVCAS